MPNIHSSISSAQMNLKPTPSDLSSPMRTRGGKSSGAQILRPIYQQKRGSRDQGEQVNFGTTIYVRDADDEI